MTTRSERERENRRWNRRKSDRLFPLYLGLGLLMLVIAFLLGRMSNG